MGNQIHISMYYKPNQTIFFTPKIERQWLFSGPPAPLMDPKLKFVQFTAKAASDLLAIGQSPRSSWYEGKSRVIQSNNGTFLGDGKLLANWQRFVFRTLQDLHACLLFAWWLHLSFIRSNNFLRISHQIQHSNELFGGLGKNLNIYLIDQRYQRYQGISVKILGYSEPKQIFGLQHNAQWYRVFIHRLFAHFPPFYLPVKSLSAGGISKDNSMQVFVILMWK